MHSVAAHRVPTDRIKDRRFLWGILLVCVSSIPVWMAIFNSFRGLSANKATGLGAVAGGIAGVFFPFGLGLTLACSVVGIAFLVRAFSRKHWLRSVFSAFAICFSALTILFAGFSCWFIYWGMRR